VRVPTPRKISEGSECAALTRDNAAITEPVKPSRERACGPFAQLLVTPEMVQQVALDSAMAERLVKMLAVYIDQHLTEGLELLNRNGIAVDKCAGPAIGTDDPAQQACVVFIEFLFVEPRSCLRQGRYVEFGTEFGPLRAGTHEFAAATLTEHQSQGVHEDRFARPGFAGEHGHSGLEFDVDPVDDREITHLQVHQHG
jgi:hypothetical protein